MSLLSKTEYEKKGPSLQVLLRSLSIHCNDTNPFVMKISVSGPDQLDSISSLRFEFWKFGAF